MPSETTTMAPPNIAHQVGADALGTFILRFFAVGSAIFGIDMIGPVGVAFGFVLLTLSCSMGPISGYPVNPAVTLGVLINKGITATEAAHYWAVQVVGAIVAAALLKLMASSFGGVTDQTGGLGTNDWGTSISAGGTFALEVVMTFLLVFVVLLVTGNAAAPGFAGLAIGLVLTVIHLVGIPLDGTSVKPGPLDRPDAVQRRRLPGPRVDVHRRPPRRWRACRCRRATVRDEVQR